MSYASFGLRLVLVVMVSNEIQEFLGVLFTVELYLWSLVRTGWCHYYSKTVIIKSVLKID